VLLPGGMFVFSAGHPASDIEVVRRRVAPDACYYTIERHAIDWRGWGEPFPRIEFYRRSLADTLNPVARAGLVLDHVLEPRPTERMRETSPESYEKLSLFPGFICIRAIRPD